MELKDRVRKVDLTAITPEQADALSVQISAKINSMVDETIVRCNELLNIYGMKAKMAIVIEPLDENKKTEELVAGNLSPTKGNAI